MQRIIIASGPVIVENNKALLVKHKDSFFKFCGGTVEKMENFIKSAQREAKEELNIKIALLDNNPFIMYSKKEIGGIDYDVILVHYLAKRIGDIKPGSDIKEWAWIDIEKLDQYELAPNIIPALKHFNFKK